MLFLCLLFDRNEEQLIASKSSGGVLQNQVNAFQWNCIDGFYENGVENLCMINALPVGTYPRSYSDLILKSKIWEYNGVKHFQLGSVNLPVLKQFGRYIACKKLIKKIGQKDILIYSPYQPFMKAIKQLDKSYKVTLIVPDLPEHYDYATTGKFKKILRKINNRSIEKCMSRIDRFVLLTEWMKGPLNVGDRPYIVVEGICESSKTSSVREICKDKKSILYAGSLNKCFGIDVLVDAFMCIPNEDYELWLCGGGDYQDTIKELAQKDKRIKYFGYVSKDEVSDLRSKATTLVNPRQNSGEYTKYSFPSKTMEYLLSGVPVVAYKLDGIPDEYDSFFNYVKDNTPQTLAEVLMDVCEDTTGKYESKAKQAADFVLTCKNPSTQSKKIIELMRGG